MIKIPRHGSGASKVHEFWTVHLSWMLILELVPRKKRKVKRETRVLLTMDFSFKIKRTYI